MSILLFIAALTVYWLAAARLQVWFLRSESWAYSVLIDEATYSFVVGLCLSIIAASIFYFFINYLPEQRRRKNIATVLRKVSSVILHVYKEAKIHGHEMSAKNVSDEIEEVWLREQIGLLRRKDLTKKQKYELFLQLKCVVDTAHSQQAEIEGVLILASSISERHALEWLNLMTKCRLLAEEYEDYRNDPMMMEVAYNDTQGDRPISFDEKDGKKSMSQMRLLALQFRTLEYFEACLHLDELTKPLLRRKINKYE